MSKKGTWRATLGITTVLLLCLVLAVAGCGKKDEGDVDGGEQVTTEEMKQTFDVETGQYFDFSLESNPTTGYTWQADRSPDGKIVQLVSNDFLPPSGDLVGAPGEEVWQFQAVGVGSTTMVLEYSQAWDTETPPAKRYTLTVNVAQGDNEINQSFKLEAGKTFDLTLDTNPSAGYSWSMTQQPDANILKLVSNDVTGGGAMGAPQQQVWRFQAVNAGNTSFVLEYKGPGASAPVERKDNVKVTVTAAPAPAPTPPKTYTDPSAPITAQRGEVFILQVKAAGGAGYQWRLAGEVNTSMLKFMGSATSSSPQIGGEAVTEFTFEALGPGQQAIKLGLYGPGSDTPSQVETFNVTVK